jgi:hypothetical protein
VRRRGGTEGKWVPHRIATAPGRASPLAGAWDSLRAALRSHPGRKGRTHRERFAADPNADRPCLRLELLSSGQYSRPAGRPTIGLPFQSSLQISAGDKHP